MNLATIAFESAFGQYAGMFVTLSVVVFAIATVSGWSVFGAQCMEYLGGKRKPFLAVFVGCVFVGAVTRLELVWGIADMLNGMMAVPNLVAVTVLGLRGEITVNSKR
jgi:AGCS family alanine or glycine:cation symporter